MDHRGHLIAVGQLGDLIDAVDERFPPPGVLVGQVDDPGTAVQAHALRGMDDQVAVLRPQEALEAFQRIALPHEHFYELHVQRSDDVDVVERGHDPPAHPRDHVQEMN